MEKVTYTVKVYVMKTWATGTARGTGVRTFEIEEDATIMGGLRAIDAAVEQCNGHDLCDVHSPDISPNPAELGWAVA